MGAIAAMGWTTASIAVLASPSHAMVPGAASAGVFAEDDPGSDTGGSDTGGSDTGGSDTGGSDSGGSDSGGSDSSGSGESNDASDPTPEASPSAVDDEDQRSDDPAGKPSDEASDSTRDDPADEPSDDPADAPSDAASDEPSDDPTDESFDDATQSEGEDEVTDEYTDEGDGSSDPDAEGDQGAEGIGELVTVDPETATTTTITEGGELSLRVDTSVGQDAEEAQIQVSGSGLAMQVRYEVWIFSQPQLVTTGFTDDAGAFQAVAGLPDVEPGDHTVILRSTGADGQPIEAASGLSVGPDGAVLAIDLGVDASGLVAPALPSSQKAPAYTPVRALDNPEAVVVTAVAGLTIASAIGASVAAAGVAAGAGELSSSRDGGGRAGGSRETGGGSRPSKADEAEGSVEGEVRAMQDDFEDGEVETVRSRGLRSRFTATGSAPGDASALHRIPGTELTDGLAYASVLLAAPRSPLMARAISDAAPMRAMVGSLSLIPPVAAIILGILGSVLLGGVAEPPTLAILIPLLVIGALDALAGLLGWLAFALAVVVQGGIVGWESARTLTGLALLLVGPALIAGSFREIRRTSGMQADPWERLVDLVVVPLLGGWAAMNIALALPSLGGAAFPVADSAGVVGLTVMVALIAKVGLEEAAARWFPERMAAVVPRRTATPGATQKVISAFLRTAAFLFVSAAFVGNVWQLWVAGALFLIPALLAPLANRLPNNAGLWQVLPDGVPKVGLLLLVSWVISAVALTRLGDSAGYAKVAFVVLAIPGFILSILGLVARGPREGDVRWYRRASMTWPYRLGGIVVLIGTAWLALNI